MKKLILVITHHIIFANSLDRITLLPQYKFYAEHIWTNREVGSDKKPEIKDERWIGTMTRASNALTFTNTHKYLILQ